MSLQYDYNIERHSDIGGEIGVDFCHKIYINFRHNDSNLWEDKWNVHSVLDASLTWSTLIEHLEIFLKGTLFNWDYRNGNLDVINHDVAVAEGYIIEDATSIVNKANFDEVNDYIFEIISYSMPDHEIEGVVPQRIVYTIPASESFNNLLDRLSWTLRGIGYSYSGDIRLCRNPNHIHQRTPESSESREEESTDNPEDNNSTGSEPEDNPNISVTGPTQLVLNFNLEGETNRTGDVVNVSEESLREIREQLANTQNTMYSSEIYNLNDPVWYSMSSGQVDIERYNVNGEIGYDGDNDGEEDYPNPILIEKDKEKK